ncbi:Protein SABRE, partial [Coemansia sp. RSA 25]
SDCAEDAAFGESGHSHLTPPEDESIVKTRSLIELENVQVFTAKRDDFESQAAYFVDCTYGSQLEGSDASQPSPIWPAWIPIELLLSQGKHRARGIFDELDDAGAAAATANVGHGFVSDSGSDSDGQSLASGSFVSDGQSQIPGPYRERRGSKYSKAWWLEDLSKYKRLMDRNNGLVVYDKANPHRIQGDTSDRGSFSAAEEGAATAPMGDVSGASGVAPAAANAGYEANAADKGDSFGNPERKQAGDPADGNASDDGDSIDEAEAVGSNQGLSHRANHFAVFLPELNLACTAEQYTAIYETVTELIVFIDPEKAAYMDHLNTILLGMDMGDLRGLLAVIRATQQALRERLPIIQDWYKIQRSNAVLFRDASRAMVDREHWPLMTLDITRQKARATSLLTLDRHRQALELQLRTAMDLFGAAQKQLGPQSRAVEGGRGTRARSVPRSQPSSRRPTLSSATGDDDQPPPATAPARRRMSLLSASSRSTGSQAADGSQNTIARTIHLYISKATWHMLENDGQPLCDMTLRRATLKAVTTSDQATHLLSEVHLLYIVNRLPSPMFTDLVGPYVRPKHSKPDFCVEKMIRVRWSELAPVGGISIVERFEVDLFPLRLQFSHDIAQKLINYLYPPQESAVGAADVPEPITRSRRSTFTTPAADGTPSAF